MAHPINKTGRRPRIHKDSLETVEIEIKLTPQQELFAQNYMACKCNASEAYRQAYDCKESSVNTICTEAYKLLQNPYIAHRIEVLHKESAERNKVTVDSLTAEYEEIRNLAMTAKEYAPAVSAINGKAKIHGLDKLIIEGDLKLVKIKDMTGKK